MVDVAVVDVSLWLVLAATIVPAHAAAWRRGGALLVGLAAADAVALALAAVPAASTRAWLRVAQEDGVVEWATTFAFIAAGLLALRTLRDCRASAPFAETLVRAGLVLFCFGVAGEEISWGQRLLSFQPPELFLERNFQQELNVHNVLMSESSGLGFEVDSKHLVAFVALAFGVVGPLLTRVRRVAFLSSIAPPWPLAPVFLAVVVAELTYPVELTGEGAELLLGVAFALTAALPLGRRAVALAAIVPLALGAVTAPILARVVFGADEAGTALARAELTLLSGDLARGAAPRLQRKSSIHKRVYTATRDGYFDVADAAFLEGDAARRDRRGFFLDPWNNPYWVLVERKTRRAVVYSFGPNRQRDSEPRELDAPVGDDVVMAFSLAP